MFKPEHESALRHQIRSLERLNLQHTDAFGSEFNAVVDDQRRLLEEVRIEIHNQVRQARGRGASCGYFFPLGREVFENDPITAEDWNRIATYGPIDMRRR